MKKNKTGSWIAPLPFCNEVTHLPNSCEEAFKRLKSTRKTLDRKPDMKKHYFAFMQKTLDNGHAEPVPPSGVVTSKPCWFLPHFGVYYPQKTQQVTGCLRLGRRNPSNRILRYQRTFRFETHL